jgi:hypothetical protein
LVSAALSACSVFTPWADVAKSTVVPLSTTEDRGAALRECERHTARAHFKGDRPAGMAPLEREASEFRLLFERALSYRAGTIDLARRLRGKIQQRVPLSGDELAALKRSEAEHLALRSLLLEMAAAHECWLDTEQFDRPPHRLSQGERLKGLMLSLSAALVLYDNYLLAMALYQDSVKLRRYLNNRDIGYGIAYGELNRASLSFMSLRNRRRVREALAYYEREAAARRPGWGGDEVLRYLDQIIAQSPSYNLTRRPSLRRYLADRFELFGLLTVDTLLRLRDEGIHLLSMVFGDTVGLFASRRGRLYALPILQAELEQVLRAGDILLERTPFRLTDALIPGYWGHSAVWVGTESELRELGVWFEPVVVAQHGAIREGRRVAEALRYGVKLNTLRHFLNVDDLAVVRLRGEARAERAAAIVHALRQIGKRYDFNFDIETTDRIVCSELVYDTYPQMEWPTHRFLGRVTINPDDIAATALKDGALFVVRLYHDGHLLPGDPASRMAELMHWSKRAGGAARGPDTLPGCP